MKTSSYYLELLVTGDSGEICKLYDLCFPMVQKFVLQNKGNIEDAKDIFQAMCLQDVFGILNISIKQVGHFYLGWHFGIERQINLSVFLHLSTSRRVLGQDGQGFVPGRETRVHHDLVT